MASKSPAEVAAILRRWDLGAVLRLRASESHFSDHVIKLNNGALPRLVLYLPGRGALRLEYHVTLIDRRAQPPELEDCTATRSHVGRIMRTQLRI
jgi:hypothetical protein